jgi:hypothetical protein
MRMLRMCDSDFVNKSNIVFAGSLRLFKVVGRIIPKLITVCSKSGLMTWARSFLEVL